MGMGCEPSSLGSEVSAGRNCPVLKVSCTPTAPHRRQSARHFSGNIHSVVLITEEDRAGKYALFVVLGVVMHRWGFWVSIQPLVRGWDWR